MTRKDYIAIAEALLGARQGAREYTQLETMGTHVNAVEKACRLIADKLAEDSSNFNREHFLAVARGDRALTSKPPRKKKAA